MKKLLIMMVMIALTLGVSSSYAVGPIISPAVIQGAMNAPVNAGLINYYESQMEKEADDTPELFQCTEGVDFDGDGVDDCDDNCPDSYNSRQGDKDGDGVGDWCDNCMFIENEDQADSDDDGYGDACALDEDGDGVPNNEDNCPYIANTDQANEDNDFDGDACDTEITQNSDSTTTPTIDPSMFGSASGQCALVMSASSTGSASAIIIMFLTGLSAITIKRKEQG